MNKENIVLEALKNYGTTEIVGKEHNVKVLEYFKDAGHEWVKDDETAWCAAFANAILHRLGLPTTGRLNARSFLELGQDTKTPEAGDIVVLWRVAKDSQYGHVGFYIGHDTSWVYILGGNQANSVNITKYPIYMVLGYRDIFIK